MARDYKLISGDSHVNEPPDLWMSRVPEQFRGRAPRMIRMEQGDAWVMEGAMTPINFGLNQCAATPYEKRSPWVRWEEVNRGGFDPAVRLQDQDKDGVDAEIMYPTPRIFNSLFFNRQDRNFHIACIRAYNDWISEYCAQAPNRLLGLAVIPAVGPQHAVEELRRAMKLPGMRGINIGQYPSGGVVLTRDDDPFWAACQDMDVPVGIHVSLATAPPSNPPPGVVLGEFRFMDAPQRAFQFMYGGVFDRFPRLQVVFAEVDAAWVPCVKEQMDIVWSRGIRKPGEKPPLAPSAYLDRNTSWVFITDTIGIKLRHEIGVDNMLWSSDHPHSFSSWPDSWKRIEEQFAGVPEDEKHRMLAGNAMRLYHLS